MLYSERYRRHRRHIMKRLKRCIKNCFPSLCKPNDASLKREQKNYLEQTLVEALGGYRTDPYQNRPSQNGTPTKRPTSKGPAPKGPETKGPASKGPASKGPGYERSGVTGYARKWSLTKNSSCVWFLFSMKFIQRWLSVSWNSFCVDSVCAETERKKYVCST